MIVVTVSSDWEKTMALKTMSIEKLRDLHSKVEAAIHSKVTQRRHELESELSKLARHDGGRGGGKVGRGGARGSVAPKYRNPETQRDLGRSRIETTLDGCRFKVGQEVGRFSYCRSGQSIGGQATEEDLERCGPKNSHARPTQFQIRSGTLAYL